MFAFNRICSLALLRGKWLPLALLRAGRCEPFVDVKEEIRKLYNARGVQQSGASGWEEGHKQQFCLIKAIQEKV